MKKSSNGFFGGSGGEGAPRPSKEDLATAWDVAIRAHYLSHEMRFYCAKAGLPANALTRLAAVNLEQWATRFGAELEALEKLAS